MAHPCVDSTIDSPFGKYTAEEFYSRHQIVHTESFIKNARGVRLFTQCWTPLKAKPKGLVMVCHGYGSDSGWFVQLTAIFFAKKGYSVHAIDHEGHGRSEGVRGYVFSIEAIVDDCQLFFDSVRKADENAGLPAFLYGESLGGAIILLIHLRQPEVYKGAVLNGAMCGISNKYKPPWPLEELLRFVGRWAHQWPLVPTKDIASVSFKEEWKRTLARNNPRRYSGRPRVGTAIELLRVVKEIEKRSQEVTIPFIVCHGKGDVVTDPAGSEALYLKASSVDKTLHLYEEMWHQLVGEPSESVEKVFGDIIAWLDARALTVTES